MSDARTLALIFQLGGGSNRPAAAAALASQVSARALFAFVRDQDVHVLVPAPGLRQTHPGGPSWRALLETCAKAGRHQGVVAYPDQANLCPATAFSCEEGAVFVFIGATVTLDETERQGLALAGLLLGAEHAAVIAAGTGAAAREAAQHAGTLTGALDRARLDLERSLSESARLNRELHDAAQRERDLRQEAESANRAKDEFLAMLGHELRNPLAPIVTVLQLMKMRGQGDKREIEMVQRQLQRLIRLVDDLLDISRITRGKAELRRAPVELAQVVTEAVDMTSPLLERRRHRLKVSVPSQGMLLHADEGRLVQVVANLLNNAARYTPPAGDISLGAVREGDQVVITVQDSGIGIDAETLPRIFDLFVQGKRDKDRSEGGLGLGLALVRTLVSLHGGSVSVRSEGKDRGSEFTVRLPALPHGTPHEVPPRTDSQPMHDAGPRLRVMIVDDNTDAAEALAEFISMHGHEVAVAHDGPAALGVFDRFEPEVAILDIGLPVMDGYELAQRLRARPKGSKTRLIAVTGYGRPTDRAQSKTAGFDCHLVKPVDLAQLVDQLHVGCP